jgi:hypothetical protein
MKADLLLKVLKKSNYPYSEKKKRDVREGVSFQTSPKCGNNS